MDRLAALRRSGNVDPNVEGAVKSSLAQLEKQEPQIVPKAPPKPAPAPKPPPPGDTANVRAPGTVNIRRGTPPYGEEAFADTAVRPKTAVAKALDKTVKSPPARGPVTPISPRPLSATPGGISPGEGGLQAEPITPSPVIKGPSSPLANYERMVGGPAPKPASPAEATASVAKTAPMKGARPAGPDVVEIPTPMQGGTPPAQEPRFSLQQNQGIKRAQQGLVDYDQPSDSPANSVRKAIAADTREALSNQINDFAARSSDPEAKALAQEYAKANARDADYIAAHEAAKRGANRFEKNGAVGLKDLAAIGVGGPFGAAYSIGRRYAAGGAARAAYGIGGAMGKIGAALKTNPASLGKYAGALLTAAQQGPASLAAKHFVLSTSDPGYQAMHNDLPEAEPERE